MGKIEDSNKLDPQEEPLLFDERGNPLDGPDLQERKKLVYAVYKTEFYNKHGDRGVTFDQEGELPYFLQERKFPRRLNIAPEEYETIHDALPEIDRLWEAIKALPKPVYANDLTEWKNAVLEHYDASFEDWYYVSRRMLESRKLWKDTRQGHERDVFRGRLLQDVLADWCPNRPEHGYEELERIAKKFKTDRK